jgi:hypothetical protein
VDQARAGLGHQHERVIDRLRRSCESKAILSYAASIFPIRQRKGNVEALEEKMTAPFASDSKGVFVDVHAHGGYMGWPWGFANRCTPNNAGLGALGQKFASFSRYGLWAPKMPNRLCESKHLFYDCAYRIHWDDDRLICTPCIPLNAKLILHCSDGFDGSIIDTMYGWLGAALFFLKIGRSFYQPCNTLLTVINKVFPAFLMRACMRFCT